MTVYSVKAGDNLWTIAKNYGTTVGDIVRDNPEITDPNLIYPGQLLQIPGGVATLEPTAPAPVVPPVDPNIYIVRPGDSLSKIAQVHYVTLSSLEAANPQIKDPNLIYPGQPITIPSLVEAAPVEAAPVEAAPVEAAPVESPYVTMYDAVGSKAGNIPADAKAILEYIDGPVSEWTPGEEALFPNAIKKTCTVFGGDADVYDIEKGDGTPRSAALWLKLYPGRTLYFSKDAEPAIDTACAGLTFNKFIADWTGTEHMVPGAVATQWQSTDLYDISAAEPSWLS